MIDINKYGFKLVKLCAICGRELIPELDGNGDIRIVCKEAIRNGKKTNKAEQLSYLENVTIKIKRVTQSNSKILDKKGDN